MDKETKFNQIKTRYVTNIQKTMQKTYHYKNENKIQRV